MELMPCKNISCNNAEFYLAPDGRIYCTDPECFTTYGTWTQP